jgi:hypothetical protein
MGGAPDRFVGGDVETEFAGELDPRGGEERPRGDADRRREAVAQKEAAFSGQGQRRKGAFEPGPRLDVFEVRFPDIVERSGAENGCRTGA